MTRLRIVSKAPAPFCAGLSDTEIFLVDEDGVERPILNVSAVTWSCRQGEIATATLTFEDVEIDAIGVVEP